jgi:hypothetical protein
VRECRSGGVTAASPAGHNPGSVRWRCGMNRRRFLRKCATTGGLAVGAGGLLFVRRGQARAALNARLLDEALPPLTRNTLRELHDLPARAREEVRRYFHGR